MPKRPNQLRKAQTDAERRLWHFLRNRSLNGHKFRRQHPVGPYICDFICLERQLVVEIDGGQHAIQIDRDANRTAYLESRGFRVIRFWNNEVLTQTQAVFERILSALES